MQIEIRTMHVDDAESITFLTAQLGYNLPVYEIITNIKQIQAAPGNLLLVAVCKSKIVGWIHAFKSIHIESKAFIEVCGLVVDEEYRGKGIGKALINEVKQWCLNKGIYRLRLRTNVKRTEAHKFYQTLGFTEIKQQKVFEMNLVR